MTQLVELMASCQHIMGMNPALSSRHTPGLGFACVRGGGGVLGTL